MVAAIPQILVVGLGNLPMPSTRHRYAPNTRVYLKNMFYMASSIGQLIVDSLASRLGITLDNNRGFGGLYGERQITLGETEVSMALFKSKALMNVSGPSIVKTLRETIGQKPSSLFVITDSLDHRVGAVSAKFGGSANGHNGVKSIISALGGDSGFHRLRIGIGRDGDPARYVLGKLSSWEKQQWGEGGEGLDEILETIEKLLRKG